jgi:uncharacterized protein
MQHLVVDISPLLDEPGSTLDFAAEYPLDAFDVGGALYSATGPANVRLTLLDSGSGIVVTGSVEADLLVECSRCLVPFTLHVEADVDGVYLDADQASEIGEDEDWEPLEGERIDLRPLLDSSLRVELPFAPVHDESCAGICPACGCNLNDESCECDAGVEVDGPFDTLKSLLDAED